METKIYESASGYFATVGNNTHLGLNGKVTRTGWKETHLGEKKRKAILKALKDRRTYKVYRRGDKIYRLKINGVQDRIA